MGAGQNVGMSAAGQNAGMGAGQNVGMGAGQNVGMGAGQNVGMGAGQNVGMGAGQNAGMGAGQNVGMGAGMNVGMGAGETSGANGMMVGMSGGGVGFPGGQQYSFRFGNGRCIYPEDGQTSPGTKLTIPSEACRSEKAKFVISETGNLKHVKTGYCVQPEGEKLNDDSPIVISEACDKKWAFTMTPGGSLKLAKSGKCIQPLSGSTQPSAVEKLVFGNNCDKPESKFQIDGKVDTLSVVIQYLLCLRTVK
jgi:hypothetical protein